jgi:hypothetical protein
VTKPYYYERIAFGGRPPRRRHLWRWIAAAAVLLGAIAAPATARAGDTAAPVWGTCPNLAQWQPNEDEQDRRPTPSADGLIFEKDQLVHHPVAMDLKDVHPGTYETVGAGPSLTSFFSIEVYSTADPHGYATLRWDTVAEKWNIGGTSFYDADPVKLATDHNRSTNVVSFGVGYVAHPADGTRTVVDAVQFHGVTYDLTCKPAPASSPASPSPSTSASNPHHVSTAPQPPANGPQGTTGTGALAITGPPVGPVLAGGALLLLLGSLAVAARRRRKTRFTA